MYNRQKVSKPAIKKCISFALYLHDRWSGIDYLLTWLVGWIKTWVRSISIKNGDYFINTIYSHNLSGNKKKIKKVNVLKKVTSVRSGSKIFSAVVLVNKP